MQYCAWTAIYVRMCNVHRYCKYSNKSIILHVCASNCPVLTVQALCQHNPIRKSLQLRWHLPRTGICSTGGGTTTGSTGGGRGDGILTSGVGRGRGGGGRSASRRAR